MHRHPNLNIVFLGLMLVLIPYLTHAQESTTRDVTLGVLRHSAPYVQLVDLSGARDPKFNAPYLYHVEWPNCPLKVGRTYKAKMVGDPPVGYESSTYLISVEGADYKRGVFAVFFCGKEGASAWAEGAHWEVSESGDAVVCKQGAKETIKWKGDKIKPGKQAKQNKNLLPCNEQPGFANTTLTIVTTVKLAPGLVWKSPEAPSAIAGRVLRALNRNTRNIVFQEASGVTPNLYIHVTMSGTFEGTPRISASAEVTGLGKAGFLFRESSGAAPFTSPGAAIEQLSANMLNWIENGWSKTPPCAQADGSLRTQ